MKEDEKLVAKLCDIAWEHLKGKTIVDVRYLSEEEMKDFYWMKRCPVLVLNDGTQVVPVADDEGNESGVLHVYTDKGQVILPSV